MRFAFLPVIPVIIVSLAVASRGIAADPPAPAAKLDAFGRWVIAADFAADGSTLVTAGGESLLYRPGDVVVWKTDGTRVGDLAGHPTAVWAVRISRDGKLAATAGYDGLVKLWDYSARTLKSDLKKHKGWVRALDFSPDGTKLATAGEDGTVILWNTADGSEIKTLAAHSGAVTAIEFSPDGAALATGGGDKVVKLWDVGSGAEKAKLEGHGDAVWSVTFAPDGAKLATAAADRTVKIWNVADKKELATLKGHKDWVTSVAFSSDGARLVSGSLDGAVKFWDVAAAGEQEGPAAEKSSIWCVSFSPDNKQFLVGTHSGAKLMAVPAAKLLPPPPPPPTPATPPAAAMPAKGSLAAKPLVPTSFVSAAGATGAIAKDGIVMVTGTLAKDTYTLKAVVPDGGAPRAIRLEVFPDPSLPSEGPGRAANGNFVVSTFSVMAGVPGKPETPTAITFSAAKADYEQPNFTAAGAIDDKPATGWAISGGIGKEHQATFEIPSNLALLPGAPLTITIDQQYDDGQHAVGKFRLSLMQAEAAAP